MEEVDGSNPSRSTTTFQRLFPRSVRLGARGSQLYWRDLGGGYGHAGMRPERRLRSRDSERACLHSSSLSWPRNPGEKAINPRGLGTASPSKASFFPLRCGCGLGAPAPRAALEHVAVMQQTIASRYGSQALAEGLRPGGDSGAGAIALADSAPKSVVTSMAGFAGGRRHPPGGRTAIPAALRYPAAVSRRILVAC
jgi:hypothetical protein